MSPNVIGMERTVLPLWALRSAPGNIEKSPVVIV
jgi:hypothetical protein